MRANESGSVRLSTAVFLYVCFPQGISSSELWWNDDQVLRDPLLRDIAPVVAGAEKAIPGDWLDTRD